MLSNYMLILLHFSKFYLILCNSVLKCIFHFKAELSGILCNFCIAVNAGL